MSRDIASSPGGLLAVDAPPRPSRPLATAEVSRFRRQLILIAISAILLRLTVFLCVCLFGRISPRQYAGLYDGQSYLITASAMLGDRSSFDDYQGRVFPGYPALIALFHSLPSGPSLAWAGLLIDWLSAAAAAVFAAMLFADPRIGWAMVMLIPHYLMNSSLAVTESPMLALILAALMLARRGGGAIANPIATSFGGILAGCACLVRPMACFAAASLVLLKLCQRRLRSAAAFIIPAVAVLGAAFLLLQRWRGDPLANVRFYAQSPLAYGGHLFTWPFRSLLLVPAEQHIPVGRVLYMWAHAAVALVACVLLARAWRRGRILNSPGDLDPRDRLAAPWLWANTLFALCIGSTWGFECFHRFTIPAQPAMFWALRSFLPNRRWVWLLLAAACGLLAVCTILHDLPAAP